jgi:AraC-like DNA-binding protein
VTGRPRVVLRAGYRAEHASGAARARESSVALDPTAVVVLAGRAAVSVGEARHELAAPAVALVNPGTAFGSGAAPGGERLVVALRAGAMAAAAARLGLAGDGVVLFARAAAPLSEALEMSARRVAHELARYGEGSGGVLDLAVDLFAVDLLREHGRASGGARFERSRAGLVDRRLRRSVEFMHDNFARELSLGEIAEAAYLSEFHFARLFKRLTGVTPHAYLASLRIEHARRLLAETDLSVAEVGERVGYQSASHFGKVFRQLAGETPTAFREALLR